ncbi:uncharacterized protein LOC125520929 isoform X1 [Triticum urartu]|uniref:uncharacterized protein LOC125520929 isoform X1 n=1 Tax=Triticum urartu TaxID=4572 RepID=UPI0020445D5B|nr:uncharacterized protein LOC125520929 isoform X1 [Triticum urartu]
MCVKIISQGYIFFFTMFIEDHISVLKRVPVQSLSESMNRAKDANASATRTPTRYSRQMNEFDQKSSGSRNSGNFSVAQQKWDSKGDLRSDAKTKTSSSIPSKFPEEGRSSESSLSSLAQHQGCHSQDKGHKSPLYNCPWSTFLVPAGCRFPAMSAASPFLRVYSPAVPAQKEAQIKQQFIAMLAMSPEWWRRLLQHGALPDRDPGEYLTTTWCQLNFFEAAMRALMSPHISRDRPLVEVKHLCENCAKPKREGGKAKWSLADWVTSCCNPTLRVCSCCLAHAYLSKHGPCVKRGAIGLLPEARDTVMQRLLVHEDETLYCIEECTLLVEPEFRGKVMKRDGFRMRTYACFGDVHARTAAVRTLVVLFHISRAGELVEICRTSLAS